MPAYLVAYVAAARQADMLVDDDTLTVTLDGQWAALHDDHGLVLAVPRDQLASIQRVDDPDDPQPEE